MNIDERVMGLAKVNGYSFTEMLMELAAEALTIREVITPSNSTVIHATTDTDNEALRPTTSKEDRDIKAHAAMNKHCSLEKASKEVGISTSTLTRILYKNRHAVKEQISTLISEGVKFFIASPGVIEYEGENTLLTQNILDLLEKEKWAVISVLREITSDSTHGMAMKSVGKNGITKEKALAAVKEFRGDKKAAAAKLGVHPATLYQWMNK